MLKIQYLKFSYTHSATKSAHANIYTYIYICNEEEELVCLIEIVVAKMSDDERIDLSVELGILQNLLQAAVLHFWLKPFRPNPKFMPLCFVVREKTTCREAMNICKPNNCRPIPKKESNLCITI